MGDSLWTQERKLTNRIVDVLNWPECFAVRFRMEMIAIQSFMYRHVANAVREGSILVSIDPDSSPHFDPDTSTLSLTSADEPPDVIVHEATHAVIYATNKDAGLSVAMHEAVAYVAEAVFALNRGTMPKFDYRPMIAPISQLAARIKYFNDTNKSGLFNCPLSAGWEIKDILRNSPLRQPFDLVIK